MICKVCGRTVANEEANFCEYCGTSFREMRMNGTQPFENESSTFQGSQLYTQREPVTSGQSFKSESFEREVFQQNREVREKFGMQQGRPMSFFGWLGIMLLPFVPLIGGISYVVLLFVWAFGKDTEPVKKNWARAKLVFVLFLIVIMVGFFSSTMNEFMASGMSAEEWINSLYTK